MSKIAIILFSLLFVSCATSPVDPQEITNLSNEVSTLSQKINSLEKEVQELKKTPEEKQAESQMFLDQVSDMFKIEGPMLELPEITVEDLTLDEVQK